MMAMAEIKSALGAQKLSDQLTSQNVMDASSIIYTFVYSCLVIYSLSNEASGG